MKSQEQDEQSQQPARKRPKTEPSDEDFDEMNASRHGGGIAGENFEVKAELFNGADDDEDASWQVYSYYCHLFQYVTNQPPQSNSAFYPSGVGKWVPASAGKAKAGIYR